MSSLSFKPQSNSAAKSHAHARIGTLAITSAHQEKRQIETPGCFMYSIKGSVPHLTTDNLKQQTFGGVNVAMEQIL